MSAHTAHSGHSAEPIPRYWLYGEPPALPELRFVHIETIPERMRLYNWEVRPHRHDGLSHALLVTDGGGRLTADGVEVAFRAPALITVPAQVVHGFRFDPGTDGHVLTMSEGFLAGVLAAAPEAELAPALPLAWDLGAGSDEAAALDRCFAEIRREFRAHHIGRVSAISAQVMLLLVATARLAADRRHDEAGRDGQGVSPDLRLLARLRPMIDERFSQHWPVERYAAALGVTAGRLNAACRRVTGLSTLRLVHARLMLEARRSLIYTSHGMAEIGYALGFEDPAYFSRFFTKREGRSPQAFRRAHGDGGMGSSLDGNGLDRNGGGSPQ
ncbi:helix-turn-helix domain-containing protein (plasmid) [Azospirillum oryzae]|uniref:Helix-turn-helix domain-containing protein n=1 Tax=Azospirillum oryzae TaxID=286727 RepID=A0A6N1AHM1_9PROT|nr:helix-turn-helix domain-containing protein [Azospirillum oryzae]KAA0588539.1 helix-turn-helix domain-containing protein [Azospirillum oryzae]QKS49887.1 helix-turn-helix domain-containing protein [Azospirillum oryzae]GLR81059.1 AraC family transcriptional regulator [Azospirillum oryzae]